MDQDLPMTKRELKELRRLEKMDKSRQEEQQNGFKWIIIGVSAVLFLSFFSFAVFQTKQSQNKPAALSASGWVKGNENAKVTLSEFADFQCPACKAYHPIVKQVLSDYKGQVKFLYKHFPLSSHANAIPAARAAEASGQQGKFFEMHDIIYEKQEEWSSLPVSDAQEKFLSYARALSLDIDKYKEDVGRQDLLDKINAQEEEGVKIGVNATPSFFINGKKIENPRTIEEFTKLINQELK